MSLGEVEACRRPSMSRSLFTWLGCTPPAVPFRKYFSSPLCLNPRITIDTVTYFVTRYQLRMTSANILPTKFPELFGKGRD